MNADAALLEALRASGPHSDLCDTLALFGQFVGSWDVDVVNVSPDGRGTPRKAEWRLVWPFIARQVGSEIVLEGSFEPGTLTRWIFSDIRKTSFAWRHIETRDDGRTWTLVQRMVATRRDDEREGEEA